jgi:ADP-heptose:LPS heptosyltransferase
MHIAAALGVPTLAIFGPTSPHLQGPYENISVIVRNENLDCLECNLTKCPIGNPCMKELKAEMIFDDLMKLIYKIEHSSPTFPSTVQMDLIGKGVKKSDENF